MILQIIEQYIQSFISPFETQKAFRERRELLALEKENRLFEIVKETRIQDDSIGVSFSEALCVSWMFYIVKSFYELAMFVFEANVLKMFSLGGLLAYGVQMNATQIQIGVLIIGVLFFPLSLWVYSRFWVSAIFFGSQLFDHSLEDENRRSIADEIVSNSLSSHLFLVIPFLGVIGNFIAGVIFLYAGLRENLGLQVGQSLIILFLPMFLFFVLVTLSVFLLVTLMLGF